MCLWKTSAEQKNDSPVLEKNFTGTQGKHLLYRKESEWKNREDSKMRSNFIEIRQLQEHSKFKVHISEQGQHTLQNIYH